MKKAFTLIELLVFLAIFTVVVVSMITILVSLTNVQNNEAAIAAVNQESQFLLEQIQYNVSSARLVDMAEDVATSTLMLREFSSAVDPTSITLANGTVYLQQGAGASLQSLTSNAVSVSGLTFTRHYNFNASSSVFGADSVSFSFTMSATSTNGKAYVQAFQSSVAVLNPIPKIVLLQQANTLNNNPGVSGISSTYYTNNEAGDLLLAVVVNTTSSASTSVADSASNTWNKVVSLPYPAYNVALNLFAATNAKSSSNTVTATFGSGAGYVAIYIYEYRGASTSSSFDASSTQLQSDNANPSSGYANATSAIELIFGATYNGNGQIPSAGSGFTLETSSTVSYVSVEDSTQDITGPVAATWQYSGSPSSSILVATFK